MLLAPGSDSPSVSAIAVIVLAVPIVMHVPGERAMPASMLRQWQSSRFPAQRSAQYFQTSVPLPSRVPFQFPGYGPGEKNSVEADGQALPLPSGRYDEVALLASAHHGNP